AVSGKRYHSPNDTLPCRRTSRQGHPRCPAGAGRVSLARANRVDVVSDGAGKRPSRRPAVQALRSLDFEDIAHGGKFAAGRLEQFLENAVRALLALWRARSPRLRRRIRLDYSAGLSGRDRA